MLRPVDDSDFDTVFEYFMHPSVNPFLNFEVMSKDEFQGIWKRLKKATFFLAFLEDENQHPQGFCTLKRMTGRAAHVGTLGSLAVDPSSHGKGIGKKFMNALFDFAKQEGFKRLDLMAEEDNAKALAFYETLGFQREGRLAGYFKRAGSSEYVAEILFAKTLF